jgi:hypothetical protein
MGYKDKATSVVSSTTGDLGRFKKPETDFDLAVLRMQAAGMTYHQIQQTIKLSKLLPLKNSTKRILKEQRFNSKQQAAMVMPKWNIAVEKMKSNTESKGYTDGANKAIFKEYMKFKIETIAKRFGMF